ncbi:MAG: glycoside hydrolase family 3 protein [Blautia sp.]|nr:glycoside hydrolase family 3 protein [Blautia sp.]MCM1202182.1 glycoside hydrolase family 3 protein [Bacteroides fragilis]
MGKLFNRKKHLFQEDELEDDEIDDDDEMDDDEEDDDDDEEMDDDEEDDDDDDEEIDDDEEDDDDEEMDEEDDDGIDDDEEEEDEETRAANRRSYRRKRRIRNQIIAYAVVLLFLAGLAAGGIAAGRKISVSVKEKKQEKELQEAQIETEEPEIPPEDMIIASPPEVEVPTMEEQLEEIVVNSISTMPLADKVAGLFIVTPEALTGVQTVTRAGSGTQEALSQYAVGGLIYFDRNIIDKDQLTEMLLNTVSMSKYPIFLAVDEEGGAVSRVANSNIEVIQVDDMAAVGAGGDTSTAYETGVTIGSYLSALGFNLNFAPVADVAVAEDGGVLGSRSFGMDANVCAEMASNVVSGMQSTGVSACLKHFPGIGSSEEDTHDGRVEIARTEEELRASDFIPFQKGIGAGVDFVMAGHITVPALDAEVPASLSKTVVTGVLRGELGFDGVVITDALNMSAITEYYTPEEAAILAVEAGADMILMPEDFEAAYSGLLTAVQEGTISEERIDESLKRIYRIKCRDKLQ